MTYDQALDDSGKEKYHLIGRNLQQTLAQGGAAICIDQLGVRGRRQDKRHTVAENQRLITTND